MWALLAGVAVAEALEEFAVCLKWPNDILHDGAKLGGILVESSLTSEGTLDFLVIGIGLNLAQAPTLPDRRTASLHGRLASDIAAERILSRISHWHAVVHREGWTLLREVWLSHALPMGAEMIVRQADQRINGRFAGLAEDGSLLLALPDGVRLVSSGDIWIASEAVETASC